MRLTYMGKHLDLLLVSVNTCRCSVCWFVSPRTDTLTVRNEEAITCLNVAN